jgi:hypothetical protein
MEEKLIQQRILVANLKKDLLLEENESRKKKINEIFLIENEKLKRLVDEEMIAREMACKIIKKELLKMQENGKKERQKIVNNTNKKILKIREDGKIEREKIMKKGEIERKIMKLKFKIERTVKSFNKIKKGNENIEILRNKMMTLSKELKNAENEMKKYI